MPHKGGLLFFFGIFYCQVVVSDAKNPSWLVKHPSKTYQATLGCLCDAVSFLFTGTIGLQICFSNTEFFKKHGGSSPYQCPGR
jgi:hypothetical protein